MAKKGEKASAETRAKMAAAHKARWVKIRRQMRDADAFNSNPIKVGNGSQIDDCLRIYPGPALDAGIEKWNADQNNHQPYGDQHLIDTCLPRCNRVSLWKRIKAFVRGAL